jgi:hypothetical protein
VVKSNRPDTRLESLEQAIAYVRALGASARENRLPPDMFEEALKVILDGWKGADAVWLLTTESAARAAYLGVKR